LVRLRAWAYAPNVREGRIKGEEEVTVAIPVGVDTNQILRVDGKGDAGKKKGRNGDLYIRITVKKHPVFFRKGDDLSLKKEILFSQAALGDEIEVATLEGPSFLLNVPEGVESGHVLRVKGKGIPHFSGLGRGDLYVELTFKTPKKLNRQQKELLGKLKEEGL
jgi:molecular chaperone DnaJ